MGVWRFLFYARGVNMGVKTENKMAYEPVNKLIIQMSAPPLISMFFQYSYNLVDSMFVAGINEQALAAVSLAFPITTLMNALSVWIGVGVNVLIAGYLGQKNQQKADSAAALGVVISVVVGVLINFLSLFIINPYYSAFTQNKEIFEYGIAYMSVCVFMQIPNMVHIVGVVGAAVATVLGYVVSTIIALIQLFLTKQKVKPVFKNCLEPQMIKLIFSYGLPSFVMNALGAFTVNFANMFLVRYSDTAVAFFGAYFKVQQLIFMTVNGLIQGCLPIMRFNYRAKEYGRLKQANKSGTIIATVMMIVGMLLVLIFPKEILFLFSASEEMCAFGVPAMRIMSLGFVFSGFSAMIATYEQATDSIMPGVVVQLLRQGVLLVPVIWLLNSAVQMTGIWLAFPITEFVTFLVAVVFAKIKNH